MARQDESDPPRLTPRRYRVLRCIAQGEFRRRPYTIREIVEIAGLASTSTVWRDLRWLSAAGYVRHAGHRARSLSVTPAGYAALGLVSPAADAALGRALRLAAEGGDEAAAAVVEALGVEVAA